MMIDEIESISFFETELFMQTSLSSFKKLKNGHGQQDKNGKRIYSKEVMNVSAFYEEEKIPHSAGSLKVEMSKLIITSQHCSPPENKFNLNGFEELILAPKILLPKPTATVTH